MDKEFEQITGRLMVESIVERADKYAAMSMGSPYYLLTPLEREALHLGVAFGVSSTLETMSEMFLDNPEQT